MGVDLLAQGVNPLVQLLQLAVGFLVLAGQGVQLLNLLLFAFQLGFSLDRIEQQIEQLESLAGENQEAHRKLQQLHERVNALRQQIYAHLSAWEKTELARHPQRPYMLDYVERIFTEWSELHGDRRFAEDPAIVAGMARFHGEEVLVLGTQKGRDTKQKVFRNFGMPNPEGYRKALRVMRFAEKFGRPVFTFVDVPGAKDR